MTLRSSVLSDIEIFSDRISFNNKSCWIDFKKMSRHSWQHVYFTNRSRLVFNNFKSRCWRKRI